MEGNTSAKILQYIEEFKSNNGYTPSIRQIASAVGIASSSTIHGHLVRLNKKGKLSFKSANRKIQTPELSKDIFDTVSVLLSERIADLEERKGRINSNQVIEKLTNEINLQKKALEWLEKYPRKG